VNGSLQCAGRRTTPSGDYAVRRAPALKKLKPDQNEHLRLFERWRAEAEKTAHKIDRITVAIETGRDGFWLARWLRARGVEAHVIHAASVAVSREHQRAKTDRLDTEGRAGPNLMVLISMRVIGIGIKTADMLVKEVLSRNRRAVARYGGLTGSPNKSGSKRREKGIARSGNASSTFRRTAHWCGGSEPAPRPPAALARR
jgi:transposase